MDIIEIPFGARDSELCEWEYTIPEGFEAKVENGKVIVKRKESEDERIRKRLMSVVSASKIICLEVGFEQEKILAWLEKQKEQKSVEWTEEDEKKLRTVISFMKGNRAVDPFYDKMCLESWLKSLRPQPKQEWSKEEKERIRQNGRLDVCYNPEKYGLCHKTE